MSIRHRATAPHVEGTPKLASVTGGCPGERSKVTSHPLSRFNTQSRGRLRHTAVRGFA